MWIHQRYLGGSDVNSVMMRARHLLDTHRWKPILDFVAEGLQSAPQRERILTVYRECSEAMPNTMFSVKLSTYVESGIIQRTQARTLIETIVARQGTVLLDAEDVATHSVTRKFIKDLIRGCNTDGHVRVYKTYQMYRKDAFDELRQDLDMCPTMGVKLVRGAYWKQDRHTGKLHTNIQDTHQAYDQTAEWLLKRQQESELGNIKIIIATHNEESVRKVLRKFDEKPDDVRESIAFAQLLGMTDSLSNYTRDKGFSTYKYVPFGPLWEAIPYLLRRLYENKRMIRYLTRF
jgi:hypothetical protein